MDALTPQLVGLSRDEAAAALREAGLRFRTVGSGETVSAQLPAAYFQIARGTEILLYLGEEPAGEKESVPNLVGMRYNEARDRLSRCGIYLHARGTVSDGERQCIAAQSIKEGALAARGSVIEVTLVDGDESLLGKY